MKIYFLLSVLIFLLFNILVGIHIMHPFLIYSALQFFYANSIFEFVKNSDQVKLYRAYESCFLKNSDHLKKLLKIYKKID